MKNKKKLIGIIIGAVVVIAAAIVTTVIIVNNNNNNGGGDGGNRTSSSEPKDLIVGKWKYYDEDFGSMDFIYTFNADGTGQYDVAGSVMKFTYKINGSKISIVYDTGPFETDFEIKDNTLNLKDSFGEDTLYKRV